MNKRVISPIPQQSTQTSLTDLFPWECAWIIISKDVITYRVNCAWHAMEDSASRLQLVWYSSSRQISGIHQAVRRSKPKVVQNKTNQQIQHQHDMHVAPQSAPRPPAPHPSCAEHPRGTPPPHCLCSMPSDTFGHGKESTHQTRSPPRPLSKAPHPSDL